jgi:hypothetical protein
MFHPQFPPSLLVVSNLILMYTEMYHIFWPSIFIYLSTRIIVEDSEFGPETEESAYDVRQW